jgi:hypothetical protein
VGQPVTVIEKSARRGGIVSFDLNRSLTGTAHEVYRAGDEIFGDRPSDELARRLFEFGGIDTITMNMSVVNVDLAKGGSSDGMKEVIEDLYTYYRPGVEAPNPEDFEIPADTA